MDRGDSLFYYWDKSKYTRHVIAVNSYDRLDYNNTNPNDFTVYLRTPLLNVCAIKLIASITPNTQYTVNSTNNYIDFLDIPPPLPPAPSVIRTAVIAPGVYTATELANAINSAMNAALAPPLPFGTDFVATYITYFMKMRIDRIAPAGSTFQFLWGSGPNAYRSLASLIGFDAVDTAAGTSISSDHPVSLMGEPLVFVTIKDIGTLVNEPFKDVFAKILFNAPPKSICYDSFVSNAKIYVSPLTKLERFDVQYLNASGTLYDFNGFDNNLIMEVYTLPNQANVGITAR